MSRLLQLEAVAAHYGATQALFGVDLDVSEGEAVALMGRNGMGKTTTIRTISNLLPLSGGSIEFAGMKTGGMAAHRVAKLGIGLVPEGRRCFANLSVAENLTVAAQRGTWSLAKVHDLFPRLGERAGQMADTLSGGEQQMLAIGRALMTNPRLLVLDEATEGLAPVVRREIWDAIAGLKREGQAILIVDKTLAELLRVVDRCVLIEKGETVWSGVSSDLTDDLADRYLGV
ncbi:ABC transporter ATP-binding protein [Ahrensia sp. R2A130]|uniref:ABC transporter ATP-binding protein n=1 Tax=Ahrensia sp. R2A130 TaxID=744979 RepID=UPI0001E0ACE6|nr:ABC transporter ATP-binding protein [Ahrensia sp. R2A130]EFL87737.1 ABC transporter ATP-binding protein [Ahrensia sp. R2A130]